MDNVSRKRPQQPDEGISSLNPVSLPSRSRGDNGRREDSASSAVNARNSAANGDNEEDDDDDYTSSSGSSLSSDDEDDDEEERSATGNANGIETDNEGITSLPAQRKPNIRRFDQEPSLLGRLSAFLPQMKSANEDLQREIEAGRAKDIQLDDENEDHDGEGRRYIEMNLGLGVLEEKRPGDESSDDEDAKGSDKPHGSSDDTNVMNRLMGKDKASSEKPSIQDLGN